ncbi:hypothetical protein [Nocardia amamiensis]|uniref:hypothetical protein n=1 Tax=Nocardia amamiensis TaxID=404578 RepID=UPI000B293A3E|nr:hypothetical protein [Nocardia amamiensis]
MVRAREWTGFEAAALQEAMRKSVREFAALLGVETTTITNWRTGLSAVRPRSGTQAILDTTYQQRATSEDRERFEQIVAEGEGVWRKRHEKPPRFPIATGEAASCRPQAGPTNGATDGSCSFERVLRREERRLRLPSDTDAADVVVADAGNLPRGGGQAGFEDLVDVLRRVHRLSRSINPEIVDQIHHNTLASIAQYEIIDPSSLIPGLVRQRRWVDALLAECNHPDQRRQIFEIASQTSGLLGYIAAGRGDFRLARAYCSESFQLGDFAQDPNLMAWARGMQSFCEYYSGRYGEAVRVAQDGLSHAQSGPQSVRLMINGVARALGRLGDADGVHRAVEKAYELMSRNHAPAGVPSSVSLGSYSPAQVAGNAATAYVSLMMPDSVEHYVRIALPEVSDSNSPWGRALVMIDLARARVLSKAADLDYAAALMIDALDISAGKPMMQVRRRASEFVRDATARWGKLPQLAAVSDALETMNRSDEQHG